MYVDPDGNFAISILVASIIIGSILGGLISANPIVFLVILAGLVTVVVGAAIIENQINKTDEKNKSYEVYKLVDLSTNEVKYVGRTLIDQLERVGIKKHGQD